MEIFTVKTLMLKCPNLIQIDIFEHHCSQITSTFSGFYLAPVVGLNL